LTPSLVPPGIVLAPLFGALLVVVVALDSAARARAIALLSTALSIVAAGVALWQCRDGQVLEYAFGGWAGPYGIVYRIDGLSALMAVLISAIGGLVFIYAGPSVASELSGNEPSFLATLCLLVSALLGMVVTGDLFNLYVFLEIASITAYTLIAAQSGAGALAAFRYLLMGSIGATFYLLGLAYLFALTGTLNMVDMAERLQTVGDPVALVIGVAFIMTGLGLKMALFPMHGWLPDAYTYAPSAATSLIAAVMTKVNAFALLRVLYGVLWPTIEPLDLPVMPMLGGLAALGVLGGSLMALAQTDIKRLFAYSSVSHLGYIALGLALGNRNGLLGAMLHIVAHAVTKCCLFLIVGGVAYRRGSANLPSWRGLKQTMPFSMAAFVIAAMSMIGVPPTIGFFSKWYLLLGSIDAGSIGFVLVLLISTLLNAWYFFRILEQVYLAPPRESESDVPLRGRRELPGAMLAPIGILAAAVLLVGLLTQPLVRRVIGAPVAVLLGENGAEEVDASIALPLPCQREPCGTSHVLVSARPLSSAEYVLFQTAKSKRWVADGTD
jgi:multicomponent Na+:H+ antiporter subunit D